MAKLDRPQDQYLAAGFSGLPKAQKIAVSVLGIFSVLVIIFWIWQIKSQIRQPFVIESVQKTDKSTASNLDTVLQGRDTDQDGLSDYDEIYVYKTSPYLEDSDSDGLSDQQEVAAGSNPNCPQGKNCGVDTTVSAPSDDIASTTNEAPVLSTQEQELQKILSGELDGATLRQLLISTGSATAADLEAVSDEELLNSYQEALKNQSQ